LRESLVQDARKGASSGSCIPACRTKVFKGAVRKHSNASSPLEIARSTSLPLLIQKL
jgi:hypothetical protein